MRVTKAKKLSNLFQTISTSSKYDSFSFKSNKNKSKFTKLPWWFKIFAYLISFLCNLLSIGFILLKGKDFEFHVQIDNSIDGLNDFLKSLKKQKINIMMRLLKKITIVWIQIFIWKSL